MNVGAPNGRHVHLIRGAGIIILVLSAGAALLPFLGPITGTKVIGLLLLIAGLVEMFAGAMRHETRLLAMSAGAVTVAAGGLFFLNEDGQLLSNATIVTGWLVARAAILFVTSRRAHGSVRMWLQISAVTDLALGLSLVAGLSVMTLVVAIFGPSPQMVAGFAWILALSFVATGSLLLEVASCESGGEPDLDAATSHAVHP